MRDSLCNPQTGLSPVGNVMSRRLTQPEEIDLILATMEGADSGMNTPVSGGVPPDETGRIKNNQIAGMTGCASGATQLSGD